MKPESTVNAAIGLLFFGGASILGGLALDALLTPDKDLADASPAIETIAPEGPTANRPLRNPEVSAEDYMMVAAHPAASHIGAAVLDGGGSAVDAIIAAQMVLNLVEPQSSGIGGGGFMLVWDRDTETLISYDGRETAPATGDTAYLRTEDGEFKPFFEALTGGASVGVPGLVRMLELAHKSHGTDPWSDLFQPAIALAETGFPVGPRLNGMLRRARFLSDMAPANAYFYQDDQSTPFPVGHLLKNQEFADSLKLIANGGADAFYTGPLAETMVDAVRTASRNPGALSLEDLVGYQAKARNAVCLPYRSKQVCGMGPPSSGGTTVAAILGLLERADEDIQETGPLSEKSTQLFAEAMRLAFADRNRYLADADFVAVPTAGLLADDYLTRRAGTIDPSDARKTPRRAGNPDMDEASRPLHSDTYSELPATTHLVAVDRNGNVASLTSSIETWFGSRVMAGGFLLNNQLTDFAWRADREGAPVANRYEPGKRPRSSMAPTIVLNDDGTPFMALGSPGGSRIIGYVAKTIVGVLDWDLSLQAAIEMPHFLSNNGPLDLEDHADTKGLAATMAERGYEVNVRPLTSGLHGVTIEDGRLTGGADPRREGMAVGENNLERNLDQVFETLLSQ